MTRTALAMGDDDDDDYAPSVFMSDYDLPTPGTSIVPPMPRSEGGPVQSVKTALLQSVRDALSGTTLSMPGQALYIELDYPLLPAQYPSVWVQFSLTKLNRVGIGHEVPVQDPNTHIWSFIQEWMFEGRATLTALALKSRDRDRLSDALISAIAFARTPELVKTIQQQDTKAHRNLLTALDENPYVAMTLNTDTIIVGGQSASQGTPWTDDILTYEDTYSFDLVGQFNYSFDEDGLYTLTEIRPNITNNATGPIYDPTQWQGAPGNNTIGGGPTQPGGQVNSGNTDYPVL